MLSSDLLPVVKRLMMSGLIDTSCFTPLAIHEHNETFNDLHVHRPETEEIRGVCEPLVFW